MMKAAREIALSRLSSCGLCKGEKVDVKSERANQRHSSHCVLGVQGQRAHCRFDGGWLFLGRFIKGTGNRCRLPGEKRPGHAGAVRNGADAVDTPWKEACPGYSGSRRLVGDKRVWMASYPTEHTAPSLPVLQSPLVDGHNYPPAGST